jgi:hypothetical protein
MTWRKQTANSQNEWAPFILRHEYLLSVYPGASRKNVAWSWPETIYPVVYNSPYQECTNKSKNCALYKAKPEESPKNVLIPQVLVRSRQTCIKWLIYLSILRACSTYRSSMLYFSFTYWFWHGSWTWWHHDAIAMTSRCHHDAIAMTSNDNQKSVLGLRVFYFDKYSRISTKSYHCYLIP